MVMITDGVIEAQSSSGEPFGFDRTSAISLQPAIQVAAAAQSFGQNDDITCFDNHLHGRRSTASTELHFRIYRMLAATPFFNTDPSKLVSIRLKSAVSYAFLNHRI